MRLLKGPPLKKTLYTLLLWASNRKLIFRQIKLEYATAKNYNHLKKSSNSLDLSQYKGWIGKPKNLSYPDEFWKGLGLVKSNVKK